MNAASDSYSVIAKYYDGAYAAKKDLVDLPFYVELCRQSGGPILEIGCGTGRTLLAIARAGVAIEGVDNSSAMLEVLRAHVAKEPPEVRSRITLHRGDMCDFRLTQKFPLVIMPFRPLQHMYTIEDQVRALQTAAFHLEDAGRFVFDVFYPKFDRMFAGMGEEMFEMEWPSSSHPEGIVRRYFRKDSVDKIRQAFHFTFIFRTYQRDQLVLEETETMDLSYYTYPHLRALFLLAGLEVAEEYGSFARTPLDNDAKDMIFTLRRASSPHDLQR
jgi:SAM-dependent methyltransferase